MTSPFVRQPISVAPLSMGVYEDPSQAAQDVAMASSYTFGNNAANTKQAIQAAKAQAAMYNPLYRSMVTANDRVYKYDTTPATSWSDGLAKGVGNMMGRAQYDRNRQDDQQNLLAWQNSLAQQQQQAAQASQAQATQQKQNIDHISQQYGPEAAFAYQLNPEKYSTEFSQGFGKLPTTGALTYQQNYGQQMGDTQGMLDSILNKDNFMATMYGDPGLANQGQLTPQFQNAYQNVYGHAPNDLLTYQDRQYQTGQNRNQYQTGAINNNTLDARNNADLTGKLLDNQGQGIQNKILQIKAQFEAPNAQADLEKKYTDITERNKAMADRDNALRMMDAALAQMGQGKTLTPQDAAKLDTVLKSAGISTDFLGDMKTIQNPKAGKGLKTEAGKNGYVNLGSGYFQDPATGKVFKDGNGGASASKPASNQPAKSNPKPKPKPVAAYDKASQFQGASLSKTPQQKPGMFWQAQDFLGDLLHNGGPIINPGPGSTFRRGY